MQCIYERWYIGSQDLQTSQQQQILTHLYASYGRLIPADLQANDTHMWTQYNTNQPIKNIFEQV